MKRHLPLLLIAAGFTLFLGGFTYDLLFAGIPYQDPTPQMEADYRFHAKVASAIRWSGAGSILLGLFQFIVRVTPRRSAS